ncbi:MAG: thioredoxin family protein [Cyanobacteria bacterium SZAS-4]|nr:thioredoxin family protein [Cyanobacteria bacterium SZAS-4]
MSANFRRVALVVPVLIIQTLLAPGCALAVKPVTPDKPTQKTARPIVYDFSASYCVPCKVIKPIFEEVQKEYKGRVDMEEIDAEDEKNKALVDKYQATAFPLIVFVDAHGKRTGDFNRKITKKELVDRVEKLLAK